MAYCLIAENPEETPEQFEGVAAHLRTTGTFPPDGQRLLIAGPAERGRWSVSVWDSTEALDRFVAERLVPACNAAGCALESSTRRVFEVDMLVAGDLVGVPQPA